MPPPASVWEEAPRPRAVRSGGSSPPTPPPAPALCSEAGEGTSAEKAFPGPQCGAGSHQARRGRGRGVWERGTGAMPRGQGQQHHCPPTLTYRCEGTGGGWVSRPHRILLCPESRWWTPCTRSGRPAPAESTAPPQRPAVGTKLDLPGQLASHLAPLMPSLHRTKGPGPPPADRATRRPAHVQKVLWAQGGQVCLSAASPPVPPTWPTNTLPPLLPQVGGRHSQHRTRLHTHAVKAGSPLGPFCPRMRGSDQGACGGNRPERQPHKQELPS